MRNDDIFAEFSPEEYARLLRPDITEEDYITQTGRDLQENIQRTYTHRTHDDEERG